MSFPADYNPYAAPEELADPVVEHTLDPWRKIVHWFRKETHALAGVAIFFACIAGLMTFAVLRWRDTTDATSVAIGLASSLLSIWFFAIGVQIARKKMVAVYVLMTCVYGLPAGALLTLSKELIMGSIFSFAVLGFVVAQCHRVIGNAKQLTAAGIPLTTKPHELSLGYLLSSSQSNLPPASADQTPKAEHS